MYRWIGGPLEQAVAGFSTPDTLVLLGGSSTFTNESTGSPITFLWFFQDGFPATSNLKTPPPIVWQTSGRKNVTLAVTNDFSSNTLVKTGYIYVGGVGINELRTSGITIFPNPVKNVMTIQANNEISMIQLYNITGQVVLSQEVNAKSVTINTSGLTSGVYTLKAVTGNGSVNKKIVIE